MSVAKYDSSAYTHAHIERDVDIGHFLISANWQRNQHILNKQHHSVAW